MSRIIMFVASASSRPLYSQKLYGRQNCPSGLCHSHGAHKKKESHPQPQRVLPPEHSNQQQIATAFDMEETSAEHLKNNPHSHAELPVLAEDEINSTKPWSPQAHDKGPTRKFVRNVYSILTLHFLLIIGLMGLFLHGDNMRRWTFEDKKPFFTTVAISVILLIFLFWKDFLRMKPNLNIFSLLILTFVLSLLLATAVATFNLKAIPIAIGMIAILCMILAVANTQSTVDFTEVLPGIALVFHIILIAFILLIIFFGPYFHILSVSIIAALVVVFYIIFDLHRMMIRNEDESCTVAPDHLVFAVLNLYVDILGNFLNCFNCSLVTSGERNNSSNLSHV